MGIEIIPIIMGAGSVLLLTLLVVGAVVRDRRAKRRAKQRPGYINLNGRRIG